MVFMSFFAGLLAGLLGIGGGTIFGPLMLEFKIQPEVAAATSSFMIVGSHWNNLLILSYLLQ
jgi:uncharacterized membrane protein YfcA